jgi:hypothetical protein
LYAWQVIWQVICDAQIYDINLVTRELKTRPAGGNLHLRMVVPREFLVVVRAPLATVVPPRGVEPVVVTVV